MQGKMAPSTCGRKWRGNGWVPADDDSQNHFPLGDEVGNVVVGFSLSVVVVEYSYQAFAI